MAERITNLKNVARQKFKVQITDGNLAEFNFYYLPSQRGWFFDLSYGDFKTTGLQLVNSCNVLSAYKNLINFGLACSVNDGSEPYFVDDFATNRVALYLLTEKEVNAIEENIYA